MNKFRTGLEYYFILNKTGQFFFYNSSNVYNSKTTIPCKLNNNNNYNSIIPE